MTDKNALIQADKAQPATPIRLVARSGLENLVKGLSAAQRATLAAQKFEAGAHEYAILPDGDGILVAAGVADPENLSAWCLGRLAEALPAGTYRLADGDPGKAGFGWASGQYRFDRYRSEPSAEGPRVLLSGNPKAIEETLAEVAAVNLVRDLVNTPAEDMGPAQLEEQAESIAKAQGADFRVTQGDTLEREFPMVHMVGRAAARSHSPRMIELEWGNPKHPRIAIIGKGVCFDTGGLDLKPSPAMALMKKDMGGAAHALALAQLVMASGLKVRLHVLVPAVENAVSGGAFRPGDVLKSRSGISVEVTNTDAEGRLILADALARAGEERPELILDFATLTGAARSALGPDLPALFARRDETASGLLAAGVECDDPCWRLPLHEAYREWLKSDIADVMNSHANAFAGATVAALFLDRFVPAGIDWAHFDTFAWRPVAMPGRPKGGEALGLRASFAMLKTRQG